MAGNPASKSLIYSGVRQDINLISTATVNDLGGLIPFFIIDIPFSTVADTVCIPFDFPSEKK